MIFSSQLGKLDGYTDEQAVKAVANHLRKVQEELEYRLSVLDSSNINELNTDVTKMSGALVQLISENKENVAKLELTALEIRAEVVDEINGLDSKITQTAIEIRSEMNNEAKELHSAISQTATQLQSQFSNELLQVQSSFNQTASEIRAYVDSEISGVESSLSVRIGTIEGKVNDVDGNVSTLTQTTTSLTSQIQATNGDVSTLKQTVNGLQSSVSAQGQSLSEVVQTSNTLMGTVNDLQTGMSTTLKMDSDGVYIVDQDNNRVTIQGGQINAKGLVITSDNMPEGIAMKSDIPTSTSQLTNNSGFTSLSSVASYVSSLGYTDATGVVSIINGTVDADFVNALNVTARYLSGDVITVNSGMATYAIMYAGINSVGTTAFELYGTNGLRLTAGGNIYLHSSGGQVLNLGQGGLCQLTGGPLVIDPASFGALGARPSSGAPGQVYFATE